jgi:hypothetical protein
MGMKKRETYLVKCEAMLGKLEFRGKKPEASSWTFQFLTSSFQPLA